MATPTTPRTTTACTPRRISMRLVRPTHVARPHTQLRLRPRLDQPRQREAAGRPRRDVTQRSHPTRPTHRAARPTTTRSMQHPTRRRHQRPPRRNREADNNRHRNTRDGMAMVKTESHCSTTTFANDERAKSVAPQPLPPKYHGPGGSKSSDECHGFFSTRGFFSHGWLNRVVQQPFSLSFDGRNVLYCKGFRR